jgi:hypothetical protein
LDRRARSRPITYAESVRMGRRRGSTGYLSKAVLAIGTSPTRSPAVGRRELKAIAPNSATNGGDGRRWRSVRRKPGARPATGRSSQEKPPRVCQWVAPRAVGFGRTSTRCDDAFQAGSAQPTPHLLTRRAGVPERLVESSVPRWVQLGESLRAGIELNLDADA